MNTLLIFIWIYLAMVSLSFVEAYVEGRNLWDKNKVGWKLKLVKGYVITGYHLFIFRNDSALFDPASDNLRVG